MPTELLPSMPENAQPHLQVAHVLFMDMIGYSRLQIDLQKSLAGELQDIVMSTLEFTRSSEQDTLICRPTGDGMALIFLADMLAPLRCALEIASALRTRPRIKLRMGLHSGPLYVVMDINGQRDVHGDGIVMAQRVMDCGDDGHILISSALAGMLSKVKPWSLYLRDVGTCTIKHGETIQIYNLASQEFGNSRFPKKVVAHRTTTVTPVITTPASPPENSSARALIYFALFLLLACGLSGTSWLVSPTFREFCHTTFHLHASAAEDSVAPTRPTSNSAETSSNRETPPGESLVLASPSNVKSPVTQPTAGHKKRTDKAKKGSGPVIEAGAETATTSENLDENTGDPSPNVPPDENIPHQFHAKARLPEDGKTTHMVHVVFTDKTGSRSAEHLDLAGGDSFDLDFTYYGPKLTIEINYGGLSDYTHDFTEAPTGIIQL